MKILEKRPLALILCIMLGGFSFFINFSLQIRLIIAVIPFAVIGIFFIFDTLKRCRNVMYILSLVCFSISLLITCIWENNFFPSKYYDTTVDVVARVYEIDHTGSGSSLISCESKTINGKRDRHSFVMYIEKETALTLRKYDVIDVAATLSQLTSYDDGFDGKTYYVSNGYSAILEDVTELSVIGSDPDKLDSILSDLRLSLSNKLKLRTNFETGSLLSALILGDRRDLNGNTKLNFARLGISHILALSGMHLAILSMAINFLLKRFGINKKKRFLIMFVLIPFYMALTGFSSSVLRSGFMLLISSALFLLSKKADAITSLAISVFLIVLFDLTAVYDLSLWLSAFATLGVIVYSEISQKADKDASKANKIFISFKNGILVSVFAFAATFALTALRFNYFSIASVITTLLFSFLIQIIIYGGLLLILIGKIIPFGKLLVFLTNIILGVAERISSLKFIYVSMDTFMTKMMIVILTIFFFSFLVLEIRHRGHGIAILLVLVIATFAVAEIDTITNAYDDGLTYSPSTSGDVFLMKSDGSISVIYSGKAFMDNGWEILDYFIDEKLCYIDNLVLACYSYSTMDFVNVLIDGIKIDKIMLPIPTTDEEINQAEGLSYLLSAYGTRLEFYEMLTYIDIGDYRYRLFNKVDYEYGEYPENVFEITYREEKITYLSVCEYEYLSPSAKALIFNSKHLFIGSIGNTKYYIFDMRLNKIENLYYYDEGRLTEDAEKHYKEKGASVHCTKTPIDIFD